MTLLDPTSFSTQDAMIVRHLNKQHSNHTTAIADVQSSVDSLRAELEALAESAAAKVHNYEESRLFRALKWMGLL